VTTPPELAGYYAARAAEYEMVYAKPERQRDLAAVRRVVADYFECRRVLEVACGTGYWTSQLALKAASVVATDVGAEVLEIARNKTMPDGATVEFLQADAFELQNVPRDFDAAFAGFWLSHVLREDVPRFLRGLHERLASGSRVMLLDNRYVEGSSTSIGRVDSAGNSYQRRVLENGADYEVLKNFPTPTQLRDWIGATGAQSIDVVELPYYWYVVYELSFDQ
jgi:2-polyprenyl-3-methyl-5-hydroxy-6-metoxy-1,4-benzoquinol methylase